MPLLLAKTPTVAFSDDPKNIKNNFGASRTLSISLRHVFEGLDDTVI